MQIQSEKQIHLFPVLRVSKRSMCKRLMEGIKKRRKRRKKKPERPTLSSFGRARNLVAPVVSDFN
jgi:hypothetical protein